MVNGWVQAFFKVGGLGMGGLVEWVDGWVGYGWIGGLEEWVGCVQKWEVV